jgi:3-phenylpropionate/cinnamic acid dioxygenase small subunit
MTANPVEVRATLADLYTEVQQFYGRHFQALDAGAGQEWADTFTEDGSFLNPVLDRPTVGRAALAEAVGQAHAALAALGERHRHWPGNIVVLPRPDGTVEVRSYTLVYATRLGEPQPRLHRACGCTDVLVRVGGELRILDRVVTRDDIG